MKRNRQVYKNKEFEKKKKNTISSLALHPFTPSPLHSPPSTDIHSTPISIHTLHTNPHILIPTTQLTTHLPTHHAHTQAQVPIPHPFQYAPHTNLTSLSQPPNHLPTHPPHPRPFQYTPHKPHILIPTTLPPAHHAYNTQGR
ncbi:hypothetical protein E2C01_090778 [Portunus trituberculatus]|uniref:Uncharacterized protein n=1 Tax=Portunus trituberculatus TaxID=210409 RepID=A0A5B7JFN1_PORTR|nr:hypothetical protein [Portunus trituberculatus]